MSVQIDTETAALTGEQRLYAAMQEFVDPDTYDGNNCFACLIGQVAGAISYPAVPLDEVELVAERFDVEVEAICLIYENACFSEYRDNLEAAMKMAADVLGLAPTGKEERCRE